MNPGSIARRQVGRVRGAATVVKDSVMGSAAEAADQTQHAAAAVQVRRDIALETAAAQPRKRKERHRRGTLLRQRL